MTPAQLKALEREWAAKLRADGFQDIESPSGMVQSWDARSDGNLQDTAALAEDRRRGEALRFSSEFERRVWAAHLEGLSNRAIAKRLCVYRKLVDQTMWALRGRLERRKPGPKRNPDAIRHDGVNLTVRLTRDAALAVDHLRAVGIEPGEVIRAAVLELARKTPVRKAA
jgi:hypothetical protein